MSRCARGRAVSCSRLAAGTAPGGDPCGAAGDALIDPAVTTRLIASFAGRHDPPRHRSWPPHPARARGAAPLARGLTNIEIAQELNIGEATVKTHVMQVLRKLGLRDRVQAVVFAYEAGVVPARGTGTAVTRLALQGWRPTLLDLLLSLAVVVAGLVESFGRQGPLPGQIDHPAPLAAGAVAAGALLLFRAQVPDDHAAPADRGRLCGTDGHRRRLLRRLAFLLHAILVHTVASAAELRSRRGLGGLVCVLTTYGYLQTFQHNDMAEVLISAIFMGVAYAGGILLRRQIDQTMRLTAHTTRLELEREERARWAVTEERNRIARELHDVISHNVSLMTLHTGGVRMLLGDDRARGARPAARRRTGRREAIEELRLMLGMLRGADGNGPESSSRAWTA